MSKFEEIRDTATAEAKRLATSLDPTGWLEETIGALRLLAELADALCLERASWRPREHSAPRSTPGLSLRDAQRLAATLEHETARMTQAEGIGIDALAARMSSALGLMVNAFGFVDELRTVIDTIVKRLPAESPATDDGSEDSAEAHRSAAQSAIAQGLAPGLYRVRWRWPGAAYSSESLAAVGISKPGARWIADAEWSAPGVLAFYAEHIVSLERITVKGPTASICPVRPVVELDDHLDANARAV